MVKKKLISILVALSVITSMGMTGVYADEPTDAIVTMEATEVVTDTATEATEVETATDIATEPTEETGVSTEVGTENTEVTDGTTESTETTTTVVEGEPMKVDGGVISFDTHSVPLNMFNGVTYKITDESGAEVASGKINSTDDKTLSREDFKGTLVEGKKYKLSIGGLNSDMKVSAIDIYAYDAHAQNTNEVEFTAIKQLIEADESVFGKPVIDIALQYAEGNFIKVYNETRDGKPIKGVMVNVTYGGSTKPYVTDDNGYILIPVYNNDWDMTLSGSDNENHILHDHKVDGNKMFGGSTGLFEYPVIWGDGDTYYSLWGYDSDCSAVIKTKVNHIHDTSLYSEKELIPEVKVGVFEKSSSICMGEFIIGSTEEFRLPAYDKGEYELKVINAGGYIVKFSKDTFTAGNDETITAEFTPRHYLTVVKKVGGKVVNASFTIKDKKYESAGEYTFETHPISTFTVTDNDTKEEFEVTIPPQYEGVILTLGDNPDVELVGLIEDKGDGSATGGSMVGSNSNPKTYDGIMGVAAGLSLCGVGAGYLIYRKKKKFNL